MLVADTGVMSVNVPFVFTPRVLPFHNNLATVRGGNRAA